MPHSSRLAIHYSSLAVGALIATIGVSCYQDPPEGDQITKRDGKGKANSGSEKLLTIKGSSTDAVKNSEHDGMIKETFYLAFEKKMILLSGTNLAFGFVTSFVSVYVNSSIISEYLGDSTLGWFACIQQVHEIRLTMSTSGFQVF